MWFDLILIMMIDIDFDMWFWKKICCVAIIFGIGIAVVWKTTCQTQQVLTNRDFQGVRKAIPHELKPSNAFDMKAPNRPRHNLLKTALTKFWDWLDVMTNSRRASSTWRDAQAFWQIAACERPREYFLWPTFPAWSIGASCWVYQNRLNNAYSIVVHFFLICWLFSSDGTNNCHIIAEGTLRLISYLFILYSSAE